MKNTITTICLALAMAFGISGGALADGHTETGPYLGTGFGYSKSSGDGLLDGKAWTPSVFGGYMMHRNFGIEGGLHWFSLKLTNDAGTNLELKQNSLYLAGIGKYHFASDFAIYAKGGFHRWDTETKLADLSASEDSIDGLFGAGAQFDVSDDASVRFEYVRYLLDEGDIDGEQDILALQLLYRF